MPASRPFDLRMMLSRRSGAAAAAPAGFPAPTRPTFDELYERHVEFLWRNARRLGVGDDSVDDVLQQVFLVVHRRLPELSLTGSEKAWLFGVLLRVVKDHKRLLRRKSPHRFLALTDPETLADDRGLEPDESFARAEAAALVQKWLEALDDDKREVFILAELEQLSAREIGEATNTNASTVSSRLRAARQAFEAAAARHRKAEGRRA
ncbi:MAG TPA: sigma-70 family RNA polymerase sigma factor [Polyangia bacterium]|nr:sigma-70 family RNA polymerase sigma factor [Polyangia bacterium]